MISLANDVQLSGQTPRLNSRRWWICRLSDFSIFLITVLLALSGWLPAAAAGSNQTPARQNPEIMVFGMPDESSVIVDTVRDGESLSPLGEMTGSGGSKWFMVRTRSGNIGWIKADDSNAARKLDGHFRSSPNQLTLIPSASSLREPTSTTAATGAITVPVRINGRKVVVLVTFKNGSSSATGHLAVDTGASQTMVSKRIARELRLPSIGSEKRRGIGGSVVVDVGLVESVNVGGAEVNNMRVSIHDRGLELGYEGLLGFDFLGRFHMSVDSKKQVMVLTRH